MREKSNKRRGWRRMKRQERDEGERGKRRGKRRRGITAGVTYKEKMDNDEEKLWQ